MKLAPPLLLFACAALAPAMRAEDPGHISPGQQNAQLAPGAANIDSRLSPADNQFPFTRDDRVQDKQFPTPDEVKKQMASFADKQAPIDVTETRKKEMFDWKNFPQPKTIDEKMSPKDGDMFHDQPGADRDKKFGTSAVALKYQDSIDNAHQVFGSKQVSFAKTTTFDKLNKFLFRRNGPENGSQVVTPAGGGAPAQVSSGSQKSLPTPPPTTSLAPAAAPAMPTAAQ